MKAKVETIFAFVVLLAFLLLPHQTFADEDVHYVYPVIETNCEQINATAYRFQPGDTLNLTFTFQGPAMICYAENRTSHAEIEYPPNYNWTAWPPQHVGLWEFRFTDDKENTDCYTYTSAGDGASLSSWKLGIPEAGEHTLKIVYLFKVYGDIEGFYEINFLSERKARLEEWTPPPYPTQLLMISGVSGAAAAFAISAAVWYKKNSAKKKVENSE